MNLFPHIFKMGLQRIEISIKLLQVAKLLTFFMGLIRLKIYWVSKNLEVVFVSSKSHPFVCSRGCIPQALNWEFSFIKDFGLPSGKGPNFSSKSIHSITHHCPHARIYQLQCLQAGTISSLSLFVRGKMLLVFLSD